MSVAVHADFAEDARQQIVEWFAKAGVTLEAPGDLEKVLFAFFSVRRRLIPVRPRRVHWSRELAARALTADEKQKLDRIVQEVERGEDLTPRLSDRILKPKYNDGLLDDWGIHHLHVGETQRGDGFVVRDGPLLYVVARPDAMYLVDLQGHGVASFANEALLEIVHANWAPIIANFRAPSSLVGLTSPPITPQERSAGRKRLVMPIQLRDGTIYFPPGGGASTAGLSPWVVMAADRLRENMHSADEWFRANAALVRDRIVEQSGKQLDELRLQFVLMEPLSVIEVQAKVLIPIPFAPPDTSFVQL